MKKFLLYLLPVVFLGILIAVIVPISTTYEKSMNAICLQGNFSKQIISLEPVDEAVVTVDITRMNYLLVEPDRLKGQITLSEYDSLPYETETVQFGTGFEGDRAVIRESENLYDYDQSQDNPLFSAHMYNWSKGKTYDSMLQIVYNADLNKMLLFDTIYCKFYFCSEEETSLEEMLAYFEGEYELSGYLQTQMK